jgi:hypothetical protein
MSCLGGGVRQGNRSAGAQAGWYGAWVLLKPHHKMVQVPALVYRHAVGGSNSKGLGCFMHSTVAARGFCSSDWLLASPDSHHRKAHRTAGTHMWHSPLLTQFVPQEPRWAASQSGHGSGLRHAAVTGISAAPYQRSCVKHSNKWPVLSICTPEPRQSLLTCGMSTPPEGHTPPHLRSAGPQTCCCLLGVCLCTSCPCTSWRLPVSCRCSRVLLLPACAYVLVVFPS